MTEDYYNDPDYEELEWRERKKEFERLERDSQRYQAEKNQRLSQELHNKMFQDALSKHNLTPEEFQQIAQLDPQFYNQAYAQGLENLVGTVKTRARDPKTGRWISQSQAQPHQVAPKAPHRETGVDQARIDALKKKGREQGLSSDSDIEELLEAEIGRLF